MWRNDWIGCDDHLNRATCTTLTYFSLLPRSISFPGCSLLLTLTSLHFLILVGLGFIVWVHKQSNELPNVLIVGNDVDEICINQEWLLTLTGYLVLVLQAATEWGMVTGLLQHRGQWQLVFDCPFGFFVVWNPTRGGGAVKHCHRPTQALE